MNERLQQLYKEVILAHSKEPYHFEKRSPELPELEAYNPLCGDQYQLYLETGSGLIQQIHFHGYGCAISKAATSLLARELEGLSIEEAKMKIQTYLQLVDAKQALPESMPESFAAFAAAREFPSRHKCASLSWETMQRFLAERT